MHDPMDFDPPTPTPKPTVYAHPFTGVPTGDYYLVKPTTAGKTNRHTVSVERDQHGNLHVIYVNSGIPPQSITTLHSGSLLKPKSKTSTGGITV